MEGFITSVRRGKGEVAIWVSIGIALFLLLLIPGVVLGTALAFVQRHTGAQASSGDIGATDQCYMPNQFWTSPSSSEIPNTQTVLSKLGNRSPKPSASDLDLILKKVREAGVNPAVSIATWGKEQNFGNRDYAFGAKESTNFENQLDMHIKTLTDARDNTGSYGSRPADKPIQVWWIDIYTPASDRRNDVTEDRTILFTFLKQLVPNQVVCPSSGFSGFGPEIKGLFYPPLGRAHVDSYNNSPHVGAGHGVFGVSGFGGGFQNVSNGAVDYYTSGGTPVYATFDGTIVSTTEVHQSSYGKGAGIIWLKSSDGNNGAIYAHITFDSGIKNGLSVKKGQKMGVVALNCRVKAINQCVQFNGGDHLHFQFYINKKGLNKKQLIGLFP